MVRISLRASWLFQTFARRPVHHGSAPMVGVKAKDLNAVFENFLLYFNSEAAPVPAAHSKA